MIRVSGLCFEYPGVRALDDVSFTVERGSVVALVGPNGAGKTTLLRCLAALDRPLSGTITMDGADALRQPRAVHRKTGYLPDFFGLYDELTVEQCLTYHARAHGIDADTIEQAVQQAAVRLSIDDRMQVRARELSRGLRQRLAIAQAIVHEPPLLLLDEPASGLDPEARHALATLFLALRDLGMTLVVSSHILSELEAYSTHMLIMQHGRIVSQERITGHDADVQQCRIRLELAADYAGLAAMLEARADVADLRLNERQADFTFSGDLQARHDLLRHLIGAGAPVASFVELKRDMHQSYLHKMREARHVES